MLNYSPTIPQTKESPSINTPWRLLVLSLVLLGLSIFIWIGMEFGYTPYLHNQITQADASINQIVTSLKNDQEKDVVGLYSQLYNIGSLYDQHVYPSRLFSFLESVLISNVRVTDLNADMQKGEIVIAGNALDMDTVTLQLATIQKDTRIAQATLESAQQSTKEAGIQYVIHLNMSSRWMTQASH